MFFWVENGFKTDVHTSRRRPYKKNITTIDVSETSMESVLPLRSVLAAQPLRQINFGFFVLCFHNLFFSVSSSFSRPCGVIYTSVWVGCKHSPPPGFFCVFTLVPGDWTTNTDPTFSPSSFPFFLAPSLYTVEGRNFHPVNKRRVSLAIDFADPLKWSWLQCI